MTGPMRLVGDYVVPGEGDGAIISNGAIDIDQDGRIVAVDAETALPETNGVVFRVGGLLMPGLVNAHAHTPMTLVRSAGDGLPLQEWLTTAIWPREGQMTPEDAHWGMVLGSAEMLLAGVTTSCEMYFFEDEMVRAVNKTGARLVLTPGVIAALLPDGDVAPRIAELAELHERYHDPNGRVTVGFAPHSIYDLSPEQIGKIASEAQAVDALLHIHLEETRTERQQVIDRHGASATKLLAQHGALEGQVIAAHGVWLDATDQRLLAEAGATVAHCPVSNLKLGSGVAPIVDMLKAGINVAVGTDGVASNDNLDLWEELKLAPLLARGVRHNPGIMDAATALSLATKHAAAGVGIEAGELRPGAWGDVIRIDLDQPAFAPGVPDDLLTHLVFAGGSRLVTDVWVAGHQVVEDRSLTKLDLSDALVECRERGRRLAGLASPG